jgi:deoxyxylulose-5-phosphate synthase
LPVVLEDYAQIWGVGSVVANLFVQKNIAIGLHIFACPNCHISHASNHEDLEKMFHLTAGDIATSIAKDLGEGK